jgi:GT2 family glycosyltransferase
MKPELSVIITSYKNPAILRLCLESLKKNILLKNYEILVLDSCTEEDLETMMRESFPDIRFFPHQENLGFLGLVNEGIEQAKGEYYLILNDDIVIKNKSVDLLLEFMKNNPSVGIVGPQLLNFDGGLQSSYFRFYTPLTILYRRTFLGKFKFARKKVDFFLYKERNHSKPMDVDWLMGSAMMTSRKAVEKVGLMDRNFFMYFEDVDWCRRFWEEGYEVMYFPFAQMFHYHRKGSASRGVLKTIFNKLVRSHIRSVTLYFWKYLGKPNPHREALKT